ncbi:MAG TPA: bifunctional riboflavin kinase/FAD synthetase [Candidatus Aphodousia gallistercoris]|nr:bifunctional riboflavin kinase/FAD synthetase [Candidatus Aphodousia gallistercoris]
MKVFRGLPQPLRKMDCAIAIGNFDGVHRGHQALLEEVVHAAAERGLLPCAVTFEPHPKEVIPGKGEILPRVNNLRDKVLDIAACGIARVFFLNFNERLAHMSPRQFAEEILVEGLHARWVTVGEDFHFGYKGAGTVKDLQALGKELGFEVWVSPTLFHGKERISSTRLRKALAENDMWEVTQLLGHHYHITGRVVHGQEMGRRLGFPTINLDCIPVDRHGEPAVRGVYAVFVHGLAPFPLGGVATITCRPTLTQGQPKKYLLETHIFDYKADCYGRIVRVEFIEKLRDDKTFKSLDELRAAIAADAQKARSIVGLAQADDLPSNPIG